ncbi:MAG: hypothetical protein EA391_14915 [Balneolaceae bacterium]|nr:MAG: hypothetical protein EA391_14915 [Balneolaceae bacterium]
MPGCCSNLKNFVLFCCLFALSCEIGAAQIQVYDPDSHGFFRQNWSALQDSSGILYFGNSDGIVQFNGTRWSSTHVPSGNAAFSLIRYNDTIHWAGNGDFGYLAPDSLNVFTPVSLLSGPDKQDQPVSLVWQMLVHDGKLYHKTGNNLVVWDGEEISFIDIGSAVWWIFSFLGQLYLQTPAGDHGLYIFNDGELIPVPGSELYENDAIYSAIPLGEQILLISRGEGVVWFDGYSFEPADTDGSRYLSEHNVYRGIKISDEKLAFATLNGGVLVTDNRGNMMHTFTEADGLPTNIVYNVYADAEQNIWAATDNGIVSIPLNTPARKFDERSGIAGIIMFIQYYQNRLFIGTTEGLFEQESLGNFEPVDGMNFRSFDSLIIYGELIIATSNGLFKLTENGFDRIDERIYHQLIRDAANPNLYYGYGSGEIDRIHQITPTVIATTLIQSEKPIEAVYAENGSLWFAASDNIIRRSNPESEQIEMYQLSLSESSHVHVLNRIADSIRAGTGNGLFTFNEEAGEFVNDTQFSDPDLRSEQVTLFEQCGNSEIWFRNNRRVKRAHFVNGSWNVHTDSYRNIARNEGLEVIYCAVGGEVWFGGTGALYRLENPDWNYGADFRTNITGVYLHNDSLVYGGFGSQPFTPAFNYDDNTIRFTYSAASFTEPAATEYRVRLRGFDDGWSSWTSDTRKDYTFIPEGSYIFEVEGRNVYHATGKVASFSFTILPPWYRTIWAYIAYFLLIAGVVYGGYRVKLHSILKEQRIRDGIARDLHDELSSTLSSINFFADAIDSSILDKKETNRFLHLIQKSSREAKEKISDIVWVIHSDNDDWQNLLLRCKRFAADLLDSKNIPLTFELSGNFSGKPNINQRKNIWLIFREILTNIARHAEPGRVTIKITAETGRFVMQISDDGAGFEKPLTRDQGNGVRNIFERAEQLKGECTLETSPGKGTTWVVDIPFVIK